MDENNFEEMSGIREVESMGGGDLSTPVFSDEYPTSDIPRLTPDEPTGGSEGGKGPIILLIATIVVLVGAAVFGAMTFSSSKTEKFAKLFVDDYLLGMSPEVTEMMMQDGKLTTEISVDPSDFAQFMDDEIDIERLALVSEQVKKGTDFSGRSYLDVDSTELITVKYAKIDDMFGITIPDLMSEYWVIKNENLKDLARKFGASEDEVAQIPDKITQEELEKLMETSEIDTEKLEKILPKYLDSLSELIEANLIEEKDQELVIKNNSFKTTRHSLVLTEKDLYELVKAFLEISKDDEELYEYIKETEPTFEVETFEEWQTVLTEGVTSIDEMLATADDETVMFRLSAYVDGKNTMATEISVPEEDMTFKVATLNEKNTSHTEFVVTAEGGEIKFVVSVTGGDNEYNGDIKVTVNMGPANINLDIAKYKITYEKDTTLESLNESNTFVINDESEDAIMEKVEELEDNMDDYVTAIIEKAPESLKSIIEDIGEVEEDYDYDYNYDYDYDYDYEDEPFSIKGEQVYILSESNEIYGKMKLGMTKEEIIALMGEPDYDETYGTMTFVDWNDEYYNTHSVIVENGVVTEISRDLISSSYDNIQLSTELGTELEDLEVAITKVKEDMSLAEVESVLGNKYFESERTNEGEVRYTWYDKAENYVEIPFDENGKVWYVGTVWTSY